MRRIGLVLLLVLASCGRTDDGMALQESAAACVALGPDKSGLEQFAETSGLKAWTPKDYAAYRRELREDAATISRSGNSEYAATDAPVDLAAWWISGDMSLMFVDTVSTTRERANGGEWNSIRSDRTQRCSIRGVAPDRREFLDLIVAEMPFPHRVEINSTGLRLSFWEGDVRQVGSVSFWGDEIEGAIGRRLEFPDPTAIRHFRVQPRLGREAPNWNLPGIVTEQIEQSVVVEILEGGGKASFSVYRKPA